jgi:prepilin signal peptidase PulO-like enzyme (type II secretory pathway)
LPAYLFLGAIGAALTLIDLDVQRLPDLIVFVLLLVPIMVTGSVGCAAAGCAGR